MGSKKIAASAWLRAPGEGLLTVSTGGVGKALEAYFPKLGQRSWASEFRQRLKRFAKTPPPFLILGVPSDSGGGICRGAAHGPARLRGELYRHHPEWAAFDVGDVPCIPQLVSDALLNARQIRQCREDLFGSSSLSLPVSPLDLTSLIYGELRAAFPQIPILLLGGDHSVSYPCFAALHRLKQDRGLAVLHFDAHTDLLERRFGIDVCFGTWTARALKEFPQARAWVQVGIRASRKKKAYWQRKYGLQQFWAAEVLGVDPQDFAEALLLKWRSLGCDKLYITHDIDATDLSFAPATGTPEAKGLDPEWVKALIRALTTALPLAGSDLVEVAPVLGSDDAVRKTLAVARSYVEVLQWK